MTTPRGYYDLKAIVDTSREEQRINEQSGIPGTGGMKSCPNCGSKLNYNATRGLWSCEMGDYQTSEGPRELN